MPANKTAPSGGFSSSDLVLLTQIQAQQAHHGTWGRVQLVQDGPADFLAVWDADADEIDPPMLAIARFKSTGTYVLTRGDYLVATARTLREVIATFRAATEAVPLQLND